MLATQPFTSARQKRDQLYFYAMPNSPPSEGLAVKFEGGCYCRKIRYVADGEPRLKAQCHCRECRYISGGAPNMFMLVAPQGFRYTSGERRKFLRTDLESPVTRSSRNATAGSAMDYPEGRHA
jgi:Glutathione-dependent formaldehyde-activating enzyme